MLKLTRIAAVALIALALLLAVIAIVVSRRAAPEVAALSPQVAGQPRSWLVVEAANALPAGRPIDASDLRIGSAPQAPTSGYGSIAAATGAVPVRDIAAGTALDSSLMAQGYALRLNPGERALALPVDELVAAGNRILPGDYVDVFLNLQAPAGLHTDGQAQARLLLSRLRVLSYGAADSAPGQANVATASAGNDSRAQDISGASSSSGASNGNTPIRSAVLAVPVAQANRLLLGAQQGKLFLALRNPADVGGPDLALFAQPGAVLSARGELSPEQRLALQSPENAAYAGIDSDGLAGRGAARRAPTVHPSSAPRAAPRLDRGIEIIRGDAASPSGSP
ncbi:Flp pilus assembly protein CpaB [Stenotrophomonas rhizophila]|uniref:Flp pilus assembly protein CpaB n=1 Tax=Stenotrophomonas rhizophila TaxID=216778 RepID=UPI001E29456F|nr:Flp pilus assembly protein CpaB [Stenotrophomonas rhizophila]MCC7633891.1 Flp pilus assembly protein CpaB [Stenotrophomonas rhizophila]MCC7663225.1 Flp pilus assembly protein CpaB [Stenotrophomonas rhizophila]